MNRSLTHGSRSGWSSCWSLLSLTCFTVDQRQNAIVFRLGELVHIITKPGLYCKMPLLDNVRYFDMRILTLDTEDPERFITSEKKNVLVDSFVKWRIIDVVQYYISVGGDETRTRIRLVQTINDNLRAEFGKRTVHEVVSGERERSWSSCARRWTRTPARSACRCSTCA